MLRSMARCLMAGLALTTISSTAALAQPEAMPRTMVWTSYDLGASGYAEASAIADAFGRKYGMRVRIQPSGSAIGRLQPIFNDRADIGFLGNETFFATEGLFDFATPRFGPQDLRVLMGKVNSFGMAVAADENIDSVADVEGKRVAYPAANPSSSLKCDAMLAFAGLSRDDVEVVTFPTYAATMSSVAEDKADVTCTVTATGQMYELAESPRGIKWLDLDPEDAAGWERLNNIAPLFKPVSETQGAGLSKDNPAQLMAYRYPVLTVRADMDDDTAYALTKALDETYDIYKNATSTASRYAIEDAAVPPIDAPFHPGSIRYLKEIGVWSEDSAQWNEARLARLNALRAAWSDMMAENSDLPEDEFAELWSERREQALAELENQ
ncbi:TAXI family TRAP transporter solute-binding subunit [Salinisphaera sp.]|uniref:TAXI family TRAP transporter solute-binding subunit n=1 Tax=Salinisphaera sp. TaxID=1914330 RepID=UPI000C53CEDB|nr:TAXI family TRAP transporter solute-binding subunit [Salinisphaera sp.]MBS63678.1 C4-dicarboxylate ABC transporter substrate-binding protein [Salinisphaera sp.]